MFKIFSDLQTFILKRESSPILPWKLDYHYYESFFDKTGIDDQPSGAYIFRPSQNYSKKYSKVISGRVFKANSFLQIQVL